MREIPIGHGLVAIVDDGDAGLVASNRWHVLNGRKTRYAQTHVKHAETGRPTKLYMHRLIMGAGRNQVVDHIDHDGLNNRRTNLRVCSPKENRWNHVGANNTIGRTSKYIGVSAGKRGLPWLAFIKKPVAVGTGNTKYLGGFETEIEAARAYDRAAQSYFGAFASLNFPTETNHK